jgi:hypothetical protein
MNEVYQTTGDPASGRRPSAWRGPHGRFAFSSQSEATVWGTDSPSQEDDMKFKQIAAAGLMAVTLTSVGLVGLGAAGAGAATVSVNDGRPRLDPGVTLWHDAKGWHVRVTHNAIHDRVFSGVIHTSGTLTNVHAVRVEKNDYVKVGSGGHSLAFRFNNYGGVDGFDFTTHSAPYLAFAFATDGHVLAPAHISIGAAGRHPAHDPFVLR